MRKLGIEKYVDRLIIITTVTLASFHDVLLLAVKHIDLLVMFTGTSHQILSRNFEEAKIQMCSTPASSAQSKHQNPSLSFSSML